VSSSAALGAGNDTVLFNLARGVVEHTAAIAYQLTALEKAILDIPKRLDLKDLEGAIAGHHKAAKAHYYKERAALHVNDMLKELAKHYSAAKSEYDTLCECAHPNHSSNKLVSSGVPIGLTPTLGTLVRVRR